MDFDTLVQSALFCQPDFQLLEKSLTDSKLSKHPQSTLPNDPHYLRWSTLVLEHYSRLQKSQDIVFTHQYKLLVTYFTLNIFGLHWNPPETSIDEETALASHYLPMIPPQIDSLLSNLSLLDETPIFTPLNITSSLSGFGSRETSDFTHVHITAYKHNDEDYQELDLDEDDNNETVGGPVSVPFINPDNVINLDHYLNKHKPTFNNEKMAIFFQENKKNFPQIHSELLFSEQYDKIPPQHDPFSLTNINSLQYQNQNTYHTLLYYKHHFIKVLSIFYKQQFFDLDYYCNASGEHGEGEEYEDELILYQLCEEPLTLADIHDLILSSISPVLLLLTLSHITKLIHYNPTDHEDLFWDKKKRILFKNKTFLQACVQQYIIQYLTNINLLSCTPSASSVLMILLNEMNKKNENISFNYREFVNPTLFASQVPISLLNYIHPTTPKPAAQHDVLPLKRQAQLMQPYFNEAYDGISDELLYPGLYNISQDYGTIVNNTTSIDDPLQIGLITAPMTDTTTIGVIMDDYYYVSPEDIDTYDKSKHFPPPQTNFNAYPRPRHILEKFSIIHRSDQLFSEQNGNNSFIKTYNYLIREFKQIPVLPLQHDKWEKLVLSFYRNYQFTDFTQQNVENSTKKLNSPWPITNILNQQYAYHSGYGVPMQAQYQAKLPHIAEKIESYEAVSHYNYNYPKIPHFTALSGDQFFSAFLSVVHHSNFRLASSSTNPARGNNTAALSEKNLLSLQPLQSISLNEYILFQYNQYQDLYKLMVLFITLMKQYNTFFEGVIDHYSNSDGIKKDNLLQCFYNFSHTDQTAKIIDGIILLNNDKYISFLNSLYTAESSSDSPYLTPLLANNHSKIRNNPVNNIITINEMSDIAIDINFFVYNKLIFPTNFSALSLSVLSSAFIQPKLLTALLNTKKLAFNHMLNSPQNANSQSNLQKCELIGTEYSLFKLKSTNTSAPAFHKQNYFHLYHILLPLQGILMNGIILYLLEYVGSFNYRYQLDYETDEEDFKLSYKPSDKNGNNNDLQNNLLGNFTSNDDEEDFAVANITSPLTDQMYFGNIYQSSDYYTILYPYKQYATHTGSTDIADITKNLDPINHLLHLPFDYSQLLSRAAGDRSIDTQISTDILSYVLPQPMFTTTQTYDNNVMFIYNTLKSVYLYVIYHELYSESPTIRTKPGVLPEKPTLFNLYNIYQVLLTNPTNIFEDLGSYQLFQSQIHLVIDNLYQFLYTYMISLNLNNLYTLRQSQQSTKTVPSPPTPPLSVTSHNAVFRMLLRNLKRYPLIQCPNNHSPPLYSSIKHIYMHYLYFFNGSTVSPENSQNYLSRTLSLFHHSIKADNISPLIYVLSSQSPWVTIDVFSSHRLSLMNKLFKYYLQYNIPASHALPSSSSRQQPSKQQQNHLFLQKLDSIVMQIQFQKALLLTPIPHPQNPAQTIPSAPYRQFCHLNYSLMKILHYYYAIQWKVSFVDENKSILKELRDNHLKTTALIYKYARFTYFKKKLVNIEDNQNNLLKMYQLSDIPLKIEEYSELRKEYLVKSRFIIHQYKQFVTALYNNLTTNHNPPTTQAPAPHLANVPKSAIIIAIPQAYHTIQTVFNHNTVNKDDLNTSNPYYPIFNILFNTLGLEYHNSTKCDVTPNLHHPHLTMSRYNADMNKYEYSIHHSSFLSIYAPFSLLKHWNAYNMYFNAYYSFTPPRTEADRSSFSPLQQRFSTLLSQVQEVAQHYYTYRVSIAASLTTIKRKSPKISGMKINSNNWDLSGGNNNHFYDDDSESDPIFEGIIEEDMEQFPENNEKHSTPVRSLKKDNPTTDIPFKFAINNEEGISELDNFLHMNATHNNAIQYQSQTPTVQMMTALAASTHNNSTEVTNNGPENVNNDAEINTLCGNNNDNALSSTSPSQYPSHQRSLSHDINVTSSSSSSSSSSSTLSISHKKAGENGKNGEFLTNGDANNKSSQSFDYAELISGKKRPNLEQNSPILQPTQIELSENGEDDSITVMLLRSQQHDYHNDGEDDDQCEANRSKSMKKEGESNHEIQDNPRTLDKKHQTTATQQHKDEKYNIQPALVHPQSQISNHSETCDQNNIQTAPHPDTVIALTPEEPTPEELEREAKFAHLGAIFDYVLSVAPTTSAIYRAPKTRNSGETIPSGTRLENSYNDKPDLPALIDDPFFIYPQEILDQFSITDRKIYRVRRAVLDSIYLSYIKCPLVLQSPDNEDIHARLQAQLSTLNKYRVLKTRGEKTSVIALSQPHDCSISWEYPTLSTIVENLNANVFKNLLQQYQDHGSDESTIHMLLAEVGITRDSRFAGIITQ